MPKNQYGRKKSLWNTWVMTRTLLIAFSLLLVVTVENTEAEESSSCRALLDQTEVSAEEFMRSLIKNLSQLPQQDYGAHMGILVDWVNGKYAISDLLAFQNQDQVYERLAKAMNRLHATHGVAHRSEEAAKGQHPVVSRERLVGIFGYGVGQIFWSSIELAQFLSPELRDELNKLSQSMSDGSRTDAQMQADVERLLDIWARTASPESRLKRLNRAIESFLKSEFFRETSASYKQTLVTAIHKLDKSFYADFQMKMTVAMIEHVRPQLPDFSDDEIVQALTIYTRYFEFHGLVSDYPHLLPNVSDDLMEHIQQLKHRATR